MFGTTGRLVLHRQGGRDQFSLCFPGEGWALFNDRDGLRSETHRAKRNPTLLRPKRQKEAEEGDDGFLALSGSKRSRAEPSAESSDDEALPNYRSIDVGLKDGPAESDDDSDSDDEAPAVDRDNPLKWRSIQLNRHLREHQDDIDAWIELVDHQDVLMRADQSIGEEAIHNLDSLDGRDPEECSYAEIKTSMLEKALKESKNPEDRERILTRLMAEGVKFWPSRTAVRKWFDIAKDVEGSFTLWKTHLDFVMSDVHSFQFEHTKEMMLRRLHQVLSKNDEVHRRDQYGEAIYIFLRLTRFLSDTGFKESAVAGWQALLELTFFRPPEQNDGSTALDLFEDFWESEVARIGEAEALGWKQYVSNQGTGEPPITTSHDDEPQAEPSRDVYKAWGQLERRNALKARLPARTMDDGTGDDPYRVVMYSDIRPMLFFIPNALLPEVGQQVVNAFLIFCGLAPLARDKWTDLASNCQYLDSAGRLIDVQAAADYANVDLEDAARKPPFLNRSCINVEGGPEALLSCSKWFASKPPGVPNYAVDMDWVHTLLKQLARDAGLETLAVYLVSLLALESPTTVKKTAKALLKRHPTCPRLYNAYALAEYAQGNKAVAEKVLASATSLFASPGAASDHLWLTWAWLELLEGNKELALKRTCSMRTESFREIGDEAFEPTSAAILKAQQALKSGRDCAVMSGDLESAGSQAQCLALLAYLAQDDGCTEPKSVKQGNIAAAMASIDETSRQLKSRHPDGDPSAHEQLLQLGARLLYLQATNGPFRRAHVRDRLAGYLDLFPRNTMFLSVLEWADTGLRVVDETRDLVRDKVLVPPHDCVSSRAFAIEHELARGNANAARAAFARAVGSDACRGSIPLWLSYIRFCRGRREDRRKITPLILRAWRHCPRSKDVLMEAFGPAIRHVGTDDLRAAYEAMDAKGLRIHSECEALAEKR